MVEKVLNCLEDCRGCCCKNGAALILKWHEHRNLLSVHTKTRLELDYLFNRGIWVYELMSDCGFLEDGRCLAKAIGKQPKSCKISVPGQAFCLEARQYYNFLLQSLTADSQS